jgi:hypothetical protein
MPDATHYTYRVAWSQAAPAEAERHETGRRWRDSPWRRSTQKILNGPPPTPGATR